MTAKMEFGKCELCGQERPLQRTYYHYPIKCECHSPQHFELIIHCSECIPTEPTETKLTVRTDALKSLSPPPVEVTDEELKDYFNDYWSIAKSAIILYNQKNINYDSTRELIKKGVTMTLKDYKANAEEDYLHTPISVLRYIYELEDAISPTPTVEDDQPTAHGTDATLLHEDVGHHHSFDEVSRPMSAPPVEQKHCMNPKCKKPIRHNNFSGWCDDCWRDVCESTPPQEVRTAEEVLREYVDFDDLNGDDEVQLLPLTIVDAMIEFASQLSTPPQEDEKECSQCGGKITWAKLQVCDCVKKFQQYYSNQKEQP